MAHSSAPPPVSPAQWQAGVRPGPPGPGVRRTILLVIVTFLAVAALAAAALVFVLLKGRSEGIPDPYAGAYPVVTAAPTPTSTVSWAPSGPPAGRLRPFPGKGSKVTGVIVDKIAGLAYARLGAPWKTKGAGSHSAGQEYSVEKPKFRWLTGAYSAPMEDKLAPAATGPQALRAAAELTAQESVKLLDGKLTPIAGQQLKVNGRPAWLAGYRAGFTNSISGVTERTMVVVAVNTGRRLPGVMEISVAKQVYKLLPDILTLIKSLKVVR
ncbi:MAG: hypothetical protein JWL58_5535 [Streptosporangiaceae bacterium]|nr:hypothetical protein [Streptosporangiaceae bacterium]